MMNRLENSRSKPPATWALFLYMVFSALLALPLLGLIIAFDLLFPPLVKLALVASLPLSGLAAGAWALRMRSRRQLTPAARSLTKFGMVATFGMTVFVALRIQGIFDPYAHQRNEWRQVVDSEEAVLSLDPAMKRLGFATGNLSLPDFQSRQLFAERFEWNDLTGNQKTINESHDANLTDTVWEVSEEIKTTSRDDFKLWEELLNSVSYFDHAKFYVIRGSLSSPAKDTFETDLGFSGSARMVSGDRSSVHGSLTVRWERGTDEEGGQRWLVSRWITQELESLESKHLLFEDVLDEALPDLKDLTSARTSLHEQLVIESLDTGRRPYRHFDRASTDHHPGVSVVDLNADGFDDIYVMVRSGQNLFFENNGDGTFREIAGELGLAIENHTSSAIFADFDNDGDKDAFLGRNLLSSLYLENVNGRFTDRSSSATGGRLPSLVSSVSAVDFDNDGLLDVYFSTYAAEMLLNDPEGISIYLNNADYLHLQTLMDSKEAHEVLSAPGPPNRLLRNLGKGKFGPPDQGSLDLEVFRNSFQSTWSDYDGDGDQDLYVANDFATNNLFRNENGKFTGLAAETGTTDIGFGMGASWGDHDNDGDPDLYISNMYSKAGRRITPQFDYIDPRFLKMARGNSLFRNDLTAFEKISGLKEPAMMVEKAGWSWGGQFVDIDNDGYLDIHALSGYYTSPRENKLPDL